MVEDTLGLVGTVVDQVRFDACVDSGGFGLIYRAYHQGLAETVAVKCMRLPMIKMTEAIRETLVARFRDETRIMYRLSQGNLDIVRSMSSGTLVAPKTREIVPYMVLEWLDGATLSADLKRRREQKLPARSLEETVALMGPGVGALAYAHTQGVVHRDVKPGNLFLAMNKGAVRMKLLDFGLAKILTDDALGFMGSVQTQAGTHFCSPSYGAPEQFSRRAGPVGAWTDVYSLALVMLECMTGKKVRPASSLAEGLMASLEPKTGSPSPTSLGLKLPQAVEAVFMRAVSLAPDKRQPDAGVFWDELTRAIANAGNEADLMRTVMEADLDAAMAQVRDEIAKRDGDAKPRPAAGSAISAPRQPASPPGPSGQGGGAAAPNSPQALAHLKATMPLGALSPLAMSGIVPQGSKPPPPPPPVSLSPAAVGGGGGPQRIQINAPAQQQQAPPQQQAPQPQPQGPTQGAAPRGSMPPAPHAQGGPQHGTSQSMSVAPPPMSSGPLVFIVVFVVLLVAAAGGGALYYFKLRGG